VFSRPEREPEYGGKKLSEWVDGYRNSDGTPDEIDQAIRQIGTNAIPYLLTWICYEPASWRFKIEARLHALRFVNGDSVMQIRRASGAIDAFIALGPEGKRAVPALVKLMNGPSNPHATSRIVTVLSVHGSEVLPAFRAILTNQQSAVALRLTVIRTLENENMRNNAKPAIPELVKLLADPNLEIRRTATNALDLIDPWHWPGGRARAFPR